jgi:protein-S-isoprenylcysteine O-methyltransferase Ste14
MTPRTATPQEGQATEWLLRAFAICVVGFAVANIARAWWLDTSRWTLPFLLATEIYTLLLVLFARRAITRDFTPVAVLATAYAMGFLVFIEPRGVTHLAPELVGVALQVAGLLWQFGSKVALGRAFGLLPACRGVVTRGPYRVVRHPIYLGYLIGHVGFLLVNFSWQNAAVLALLYGAQLVRIQREESVLAENHEYRAYQRRVRWRLLPFVY